MVVLDTNVFIYLANGTLDESLTLPVDIAYATVTKVEVLGFKDILSAEETVLRAMLSEAESLVLTDAIIDRAIMLRQRRRVGLGDAIIAATALQYNCELWTANIEDFAGIDGLRLRNPLEP